MKKLFRLVFPLLLILSICGCTSLAISAEEYFSIGMAYFNLGRYEEAERWLNRARQADRTMVASTYNLGRLAFERQRYEEAADHFEEILGRDGDNTIALRAAAYTRIRMGDFEIAERHYSRLLQLVPESADDGYNHALVLYAMERYEQAEQTLARYPIAVQENRNVMLLYARSQSSQNKVEAIDSYAAYLNLNSDARARYEYALVLEHHELYARALEELRGAISETSATASNPARHDIRFAIARVLLIADSESSEGITEMETAVRDGFNDTEAIEELINSGRLSASNQSSLRSIVNNLHHSAEEDDEPEETSEDDSESGSQ